MDERPHLVGTQVGTGKETYAGRFAVEERPSEGRSLHVLREIRVGLKDEERFPSFADFHEERNRVVVYGYPDLRHASAVIPGRG